MKKKLKKLKDITKADHALKNAGIAILAGGMVGVFAALIRSIF